MIQCDCGYLFDDHLLRQIFRGLHHLVAMLGINCPNCQCMVLVRRDKDDNYYILETCKKYLNVEE